MAGELELYLLGKPEIRRGGQAITDLVSPKGQALLYYLALHPRPASRSELAGLLWGEMPEETARTNLRLTLSRLRKEVGDALQADRQAVSLNDGAVGRVDVADFLGQAAAGQPDAWRAAAALYRGDLLAGFAVRDAPAFETWLEQRRQTLHRTALDTLMRLVEQARAAELIGEGINWARRLLMLAPWHEEAHRHLIWLLARSGQRSAALVQFDRCRRALAEELDVEPAPATILLVEQIRSGTPASIGGEAENGGAAAGRVLADRVLAGPTPTGPAPAPDRSPLTELVGRESELAQLAARLADPTCRLLTLVGPGGIGKTRLALAARQTQVAHFPDGVHFVALTGVTPTTSGEAIDLLVANLANALDFAFAAQQPPRELLLYHLRGQTALLILDNFEQLLDAAGLLAQILQEAPAVKLLVTSSTRLGIAGEWVFDVGGLGWGATPAPGGLSVYPALRLFVECARRIRPDFRPQAEAAAIHQICAFVEGSPLCIELAANWVRVLPCAAIVEQLAQALDLLQADSPIVAPRHQSMRAVLDGAWGLLAADEQQAFARLAIFDGGFTLAAAESVAEARLPVLARLVDASWLKREVDGRFRVHELLRQYGAARLAEQPDAQADTQRRHARFFAEFLQTHYAALPAPVDDPVWVEIDPEIDNLRLAWRWWVEQGDPDAISAYLDGLWRIYRSKGWYPEAVGVLSQALGRMPAPAMQRARRLRRLAEATYEMGELDACRGYAEQALSVLGNPVPTTKPGWAYYTASQAARQAIHRLLPHAVWRVHDPRRLLYAQTMAAEAAATVRRLGPIYYQKEMSIPLMGETLLILNLAEQAGSEDETTLGMSTVALACSHIPLPGLAAYYMNRAEQRLDAAQDLRTKALTLQVITLYSLGVGKYAAAQKAIHQFYTMMDHEAAPRLWEENTALLGIAAGMAGNTPEALRRLRTAADLAHYRGDAVVVWWSLFAQAELLLRLGRTEDAWARLEQARQHPAERAMPAEQFRLCAGEAFVYLYRADFAMASQSLERALDWMDQIRMRVPYSMLGYVVAADVGLALAERAARDDLARRPYRHLEHFARFYPAARPALWQMRGRGARQETRALACFQRSLAEATALGMPYEEGQAHVLLAAALGRQGKTRQAAGHIATAQILFARVGARAHLALRDTPV
ncbi:MAG: hypothetical protein IT329_15530 [Caldilineaceae bacterium]|nr:hypothetical protein [Caldilineaceae bacterium]